MFAQRKDQPVYTQAYHARQAKELLDAAMQLEAIEGKIPLVDYYIAGACYHEAEADAVFKP